MSELLEYHRPTEEARLQMRNVRNAAEILLRTITECCPPSREKSLAITKLEECAMWANKSIVINQGEDH